MSDATALLDLAKDALARAGEAEAELFVRRSRRGFARFAVGELGQHMEMDEPSVVARVARGSRVASASTNRLDRDAVVGALRDAARAAEMIPETPGFPGFASGDEPTGEDPPRFSRATAEQGPEERADRVASVLGAIASAGLVGAGALEARSTSMALVTTRGRALHHDGTMATFKVWALETPGAGGASGYGGATHRDVTRLDLAGETDRAIRMCMLGKATGTLDPGAYDVVLEPPAVSELVEWLAAIAFGAPELEQGTSALRGRFGEAITGSMVTMIEDPLAPDGLAAPFDREGTWRARVPLLEKGIAKGVLYDRAHAARMGAHSTGSAVLGEGGGGAVAACAIHMSGGEAASVDELISGVDRGLYVCRLHYVNGLLEPRRAVMTGLTRDGCFLVEHGEIVRGLANMRFTDSFLEGLARADGMTRERTAVPTWWSEAGAHLVPAVRMRGFRWSGKSQA